ncbi:hypothetical protein PG999_008804 [Apiospora kogelbergensis]|uniref:Uncharacterized protein n=1 Tax=Apiospora kogelbergensis TaxID=1337665 RepID=A0AAW0QMS9_9PEZI
MSSPALDSTAQSEGNKGKDRKGLSKVLRGLSRMRTILKRPSEQPYKSSVNDPRIRKESPLNPATSSAVPPKTAESENATRIPRSQVYDERARRLGDRFGLEVKPAEWNAARGDVLRVEKPVRIRIHRTCHKCQATFGPGNACPGCQHRRCDQCTRSPPKRTEEEKKASRQRRDAVATAQKDQDLAPIIPHYGLEDPIVLTRPSQKPGGQDQVHKKHRMRIRRYCHECQSLFKAPSRICEQCGHKRCGDCERVPLKQKKYPKGYPNDEPGTNWAPRHICHECHEKFPADALEATMCDNCSHELCVDCPLLAPKKGLTGPGPDELKLLHERLAQLSVE